MNGRIKMINAYSNYIDDIIERQINCGVKLCELSVKSFAQFEEDESVWEDFKGYSFEMFVDEDEDWYEKRAGEEIF